MDALTKVLVCLYEEPEKPDDPLEYPLRTIRYYDNETLAEAFAPLAGGIFL